jgi:hypothetical protein
MLVARNGAEPRVHPEAKVAPSATNVGNVRISVGAYVDHHVLAESSGPPIDIGDQAVVFAGAVLRSVGGAGRPAFPVRVAQGRRGRNAEEESSRRGGRRRRPASQPGPRSRSGAGMAGGGHAAAGHAGGLPAYNAHDARRHERDIRRTMPPGNDPA